MKINHYTYTIRTFRLMIRPIRNSDYENCKKTREISNLSAEERNGNNLAISNMEIGEFRAMVSYRNFHRRKASKYLFGIFLNSTSQFIGDISLYNISGGAQTKASIGLVIHSPFRRQGLAKEALLGFFPHTFKYLKIDRIEGQANPKNKISINLCLSVGMKIEGNKKIHDPAINKKANMVILSITKEDFY
jgi:RimJ/RimL family protein N-acetyltransferase